MVDFFPNGQLTLRVTEQEKASYEVSQKEVFRNHDARKGMGLYLLPATKNQKLSTTCQIQLGVNMLHIFVFLNFLQFPLCL
jgi:hypothetical protein